MKNTQHHDMSGTQLLTAERCGMTANKANRNVLIERKRKEGATLAALAQEFNVSQTTISQVLAKLESNRRIIKRRLEAPLRRVTKPYDGE